QSEVPNRVVDARGRHVCGTWLTRFTVPFLRGQLERLRLVRLRGIAWRGPEGPGFLPRLRVERDHPSTHVVLHAGPAGEHLSIADLRCFGDSRLVCIAHERLPYLFPRCRIDRHDPAVAGSDIHLTVPHGDTAILSPFIRVTPRAVDPDVRIELPAQLSCRSVNGEHFVERSAEINHPVDDNRLR